MNEGVTLMHSSKNYKGSHDYCYYQYVGYWAIAFFSLAVELK